MKDWILATAAAVILFFVLLGLVQMGLPVLMWIMYG